MSNSAIPYPNTFRLSIAASPQPALLSSIPSTSWNPPFLHSWIPPSSETWYFPFSSLASISILICPSFQLSSPPTFLARSNVKPANILVKLVHPLRGFFSGALNVRDQHLRSLDTYQVPSKRAISLFLSRSLPIKWAFSFLCARHHRSCPWIASLTVSSLLSFADFKSRLEFMVLLHRSLLLLKSHWSP